MDAESGEAFPGAWQLDNPPSDLVFAGSEEPLQDWAVDPERTRGDSESEDVLHAVDPNEVFGGAAETPTAGPPTVYQVVYDISGLGGASAGLGPEDAIAIELDPRSCQLLLPDSCVVNALPATSAAAPSSDDDLLFSDLQLTEEEQRLLNQEGVDLPPNLPLTKAEERILKKVRRKIRNKQSAQDSRRRRKEYIDGLESRAATCSQQNRELQRTVEQLERRNMSLLTQLQQLQSLIKRTASKGAQTSTCLLIIVVSLALIIVPSFSPFRRLSYADDDYRPRGVISRNILTDPSSPQTAVDDTPDVQRLDSSPPPELSQSGPLQRTAVPQQPIENPQNAASDGTVQVGSQSGNASALVAGQTDPLSQSGGLDSTKLAKHADEM